MRPSFRTTTHACGPPNLRRSLIAGAKNNLLGMVGFVREGRKSQGRFDERINAEAELMKIAAAKKAAKAAAAKAAGKQ